MAGELLTGLGQGISRSGDLWAQALLQMQDRKRREEEMAFQRLTSQQDFDLRKQQQARLEAAQMFQDSISALREVPEGTTIDAQTQQQLPALIRDMYTRPQTTLPTKQIPGGVQPSPPSPTGRFDVLRPESERMRIEDAKRDQRDAEFGARETRLGEQATQLDRYRQDTLAQRGEDRNNQMAIALARIAAQSNRPDSRLIPVRSFDPETGQNIVEYLSQDEIKARGGKFQAPSTSFHPNLSASERKEVASIDSLVKLGSEIVNLGKQTNWAGVGGLAEGSVKQFGARHFGAGTKQAQSLRNKIANVTATIALLRAGTAFTVGEKKLLQQYNPIIDEHPMVIEQKLTDLSQFLTSKRDSIYGTLSTARRTPGAGPAATAPSAPTVPDNDPGGIR